MCEMFSFWLLTPIKIVGLVWLGFGWVEVVILEIIVWIVVAAFSLWLVRNKLGFSFKRLRILPHALRYSVPYMLRRFSSWIQRQIDKVFLGRMTDISNVGVYAIGMRVSEGYELFSRPVNTSVKPEISKRLDMKDKNINDDIRNYFGLFFQFSLLLIFSISIFSRELIWLLTDAKYFEAFKIIPLAVLGRMLSQVGSLFRLKFIHKNRTIWIPTAMIVGVLLNVSLNYFLIPRFGIVGAASATVLANLGVLLVCYFISQRLHFTRYDLRKNFSVLIAVLLLIFGIQKMQLNLMAGIPLKLAAIIAYAAILYKYFMRTNKRTREMRDLVLVTLKEKITFFKNRRIK